MAGSRFKRVGRPVDELLNEASTDPYQEGPPVERNPEPIYAGPAPKGIEPADRPESRAQTRSEAVSNITRMIGETVALRKGCEIRPDEFVAKVRKPRVALKALEEYTAFLMTAMQGLEKRIKDENEGKA